MFVMLNALLTIKFRYFSMKILFITHETSLSGASRSLLYFVDWFKKNKPSDKIYVLSLSSVNPLQNAFQTISDYYFDLTNVSRKPNYSFINRAKRILFNKEIVSEKERLISELAANHFDVLYSNTVVCLPIAQEIKTKFNYSKILLHVHELKTAINQLLPDFRKRYEQVDFTIAASELVKENLINYFLCDAKNIQKVYECSDIFISETYMELEPKNAQKVFMVGAAYWAKGDDIFLLVAKEVISRNENVHFYWLGGQSNERFTVNQGDIEKLGISKNVHFLTHTPFPHDTVKQADVFALTSRSDSFPLAAIEAGLLGVPIVCFEKASGIQEIIEHGGGTIVPYLDIIKMSDAILYLLSNENFRLQKSDEIKKIFEQCKPDFISKEINKVLNKLNNK